MITLKTNSFSKPFKESSLKKLGRLKHSTFHLTRATPGSSLFSRKLVLGLVNAVLLGCRPHLGVLGGWCVGGGLNLLGSKVQIWNSLH